MNECYMLYTYIHTYIHTYIYTYAIYMQIYAYIHTFMLIQTYIYINETSLARATFTATPLPCIYACIYTSSYMQHTCVCVRVIRYMYTYMYTCMCTYNVCMHTQTYIYINETFGCTCNVYCDSLTLHMCIHIHK